MSTPPAAAAPRYGPPMDDDDSAVTKTTGGSEAVDRLATIVQQVLAVQDPQHVPRILTQNVDFLIQHVSATTVQVVLDQSPDHPSMLEEALETIVSFTEDFVKQAQSIDQRNKELLGQLLRLLPGGNEETLDQWLKEHREDLTPGLVRHLQGECDRISAAPQMTRDSAKLLELLQVLQTRILEEVGERELGPAALVLGQLIGYESSAERLAVLDAGLTVRGEAFARELQALTAEALDGFETVPNVDASLVTSVKELDERLREYLKQSFE